MKLSHVEPDGIFSPQFKSTAATAPQAAINFYGSDPVASNKGAPHHKPDVFTGIKF